jgi:hypothetical protein
MENIFLGKKNKLESCRFDVRLELHVFGDGVSEKGQNLVWIGTASLVASLLLDQRFGLVGLLKLRQQRRVVLVLGVVVLAQKVLQAHDELELVLTFKQSLLK